MIVGTPSPYSFDVYRVPNRKRLSLPRCNTSVELWSPVTCSLYLYCAQTSRSSKNVTPA